MYHLIEARAYFEEGKYPPEAKDEAVANTLFLTWHNETMSVPPWVSWTH